MDNLEFSAIERFVDTLPVSNITLSILSTIVVTFMFFWFIRRIPGGSFLRGAYYGFSTLLIAHPMLSHAHEQGLLPGGLDQWSLAIFVLGVFFHRAITRFLLKRLL